MFQLSDTQGFFKVNNNFREQEWDFNHSTARWLLINQGQGRIWYHSMGIVLLLSSVSRSDSGATIFCWCEGWEVCINPTVRFLIIQKINAFAPQTLFPTPPQLWSITCVLHHRGCIQKNTCNSVLVHLVLWNSYCSVLQQKRVTVNLACPPHPPLNCHCQHCSLELSFCRTIYLLQWLDWYRQKNVFPLKLQGSFHFLTGIWQDSVDVVHMSA